MAASRFSRNVLAVVFFTGAVPGMALAFNSGSTGADGAFSPTVNTDLQLPPNGIFNFTTVDIPAGVLVRFKRNAANTPAVILASGNVTITGTIFIAGDPPAASSNAGDGNIGDDGQPGLGGPGGYDGGRGGARDFKPGGNGLGPGGGTGGRQNKTYPTAICDGRHAAFFGSLTSSNSYCDNYADTMAAYGSPLLLPLIGGSGGGGGSGGQNFAGTGGGGGGGAILIAASGTVNLNTPVVAPNYYSINASSYPGGDPGAAVGRGAQGGYGSGGAIRLIATTVKSASASTGYLHAGNYSDYRNGRVRIEAETFAYTGTVYPSYTFDKPGPVFVVGLPTLKIKSVAGVDAPALPTGSADIKLPADTVNPVTVAFESTGVPVGNTVKLKVTPATGVVTEKVSPALTGTADLASASVSVTLPTGHSVLTASTSYTIVAAQGDLLAPYAQGERVERVTLIASMDGSSQVILTTVSGKSFTHSGLVPTFGS